MQSDEVIWQIINNGFCSFKSSIARDTTFCRNVYNVNGLCNRQSCPLANSKYATIREHEGKCYLYTKTAERAHSPKNLWEKTKLPQNYTKALEMVTAELEFFPKHLQHRNKQRLTKIHQYMIRMRKLRLKERPKLVGINKKIERREKRREEKALKAARVEKSIESELLERLKSGTYGDIYNFAETEYGNALKAMENEEEEEDLEDEEKDAAGVEDEDEEEFEEELEDEEEGEEEGEDLEDMDEWSKQTFGQNFVVGDSSDEEDDDEDVSGVTRKKRKTTSSSAGVGKSGGKGKGKGKKNIEFEYENEFEQNPAMEGERGGGGGGAMSGSLDW